ncbi:hypothetical protein Tco_1394269 [Tanacetum coccineum]
MLAWGEKYKPCAKWHHSGVDRRSGGGSRWSAIADRHWPPLTGGPAVALVTAPTLLAGHVAPITRWQKVQYQAFPRVLEAYVACSHWWIQLAYKVVIPMPIIGGGGNFLEVA